MLSQIHTILSNGPTKKYATRNLKFARLAERLSDSNLIIKSAIYSIATRTEKLCKEQNSLKMGIFGEG